MYIILYPNGYNLNLWIIPDCHCDSSGSEIIAPKLDRVLKVLLPMMNSYNYGQSAKNSEFLAVFFLPI